MVVVANNQTSIFDVGRIAPWNQGTFHQLMKRAMTYYFLGLSKLELVSGNSELVDNWMYYEWMAFLHGRVACVVKGGKLYPIWGSDIIEVNGEKTELNKAWKVNGYFEFNTIRCLIPGKNGKYVEEEFKENEFAVLLNNIEQIPTLTGVDFWLDKLSQWLEAIAYDMEMSKKNLIFLVPERPVEKDWGEMLTSWKQGIFAFVSFESSSKPSITESGERKTGFDMSQVQFHIYQPQSKEREQLWIDYQKHWDIMLWTFGICFDVLLNKEERASISEVQAAVDYFMCHEQSRAHFREIFVRKVQGMINSTMKLKYGRIKK